MCTRLIRTVARRRIEGVDDGAANPPRPHFFLASFTALFNAATSSPNIFSRISLDGTRNAADGCQVTTSGSFSAATS
jgi:hypothetical protein